MKAWNIYAVRFNGSLTLIDTVFYSVDCDRDYVKQTLVDHDGYSSGIVVMIA